MERSSRRGSLINLTAALGMLLGGCAAAVGQHSYSTSDLLAAALEEDAILLVDVRTHKEYASGHIPGAVNIPHKEIGKNLDKLPKDRDIVVYCRSGHRVKKAMRVLEANGYAVFNFGWLGRWTGAIETGGP
jgi:rhodanese-related sulfurtransferase